MDDLIKALRLFVKERDWEQFHSPKNLSMALSVETAEVVELFQWLTQEQSKNLSPEKRQALADEIGDVLIYLTMLADKFGIDPMEAAKEKMKKNIVKYPANKVKGKSGKYTEYD
ncbi:MAG TPA: nucleotide pyrophosphohydrolase [Nitrospirae bacterium]|nr:nucleotide pyrophosphohydrolase [Nitrospirota bacterium]